jgi:hypothetical protein
MRHSRATSAPGLITVANAVAQLPMRTERLLGKTAENTAETAASGVNRNARVRPSCRPTPTICPASLIAAALVSTHPDPGGRTSFRSVIAPPCQTNAREREPSAVRDQPTT